MISRLPSVMFVRHAFRYIGMKRVVYVQLARPLHGDEPVPEMDELEVLTLDEDNFAYLQAMGMMPDSRFLSTMRLLWRSRYERRKEAITRECHERLSRGDRCYVASLDGRFVGWVWICSRGEKEEPMLERSLHYEPGTSLIYNLLIHAQYRGKGYSSLLIRQALRYQSECSSSLSLALIERDNVPSMHVFMKLGFAPRRMYNILRFFLYVRYVERDL